MLGVPLDYRTTQHISDAVSTFGHYHIWHQDDPRMVRTLVYVSFPSHQQVPRDVVYREYADFGATHISWTAPIYVLSAKFADILPANEDLMPFNGNPHPLPGNIPFDDVNFVMPEFLELGWNEAPHAHNADQHHDNQQDNAIIE